MSKYEVDFHVYGYHKDVGELISAKDAESAIAAICVDIQIDDAILEKRIAELELIKKEYEETLLKLPIRDLELRECELMDFLDEVDTWSVMNTYVVAVDDFFERVKNLREQAKQLKDNSQ